MKNTRIFVIYVLLIVPFINGLSQDSLQIGFSLGDFFVDRWYKDRDYFVDQANEQAVAVQLAYGYGDSKKQTSQTIKLIDNGIKVLVIVPTDATDCNEIVDYAHEKGIKVISYDRLILGADIDYYISFDNEMVGKLQAEHAISKAPKGKYVLLGGPVKDNNALLFMKGQNEVLKPFVEKGEIEIVLKKHLKEWNSMEAFMEMQGLSEQLGEIAAVIASNDLIASGVLMALEMESPGTQIIITGQDASLEGCKNVMNGTQSMTIYKSISKLAHDAVNLAIKVAEGEKINTAGKTIDNGHKGVPSLLLTPLAVTKDNIKETVIKDGFITLDELGE